MIDHISEMQEPVDFDSNMEFAELNEMISQTIHQHESDENDDDNKYPDESSTEKHSTSFIMDSIFIFPAERSYGKKNSSHTIQSLDYTTTSTGNESQRSSSPNNSHCSSENSPLHMTMNEACDSISSSISNTLIATNIDTTTTFNQPMIQQYPFYLNKFDNHSNTAPPMNNNKSSNHKGFEPEKNMINLHDIIQGKDKRTTLMIRHIPNKYTLKLFTNEINQKFSNKYDVFYLPIDYVNNCNLGFAFINFIDPLHIVEFYETFRGRKWKKYFSDKICELAYAKIQGKKNLITHFEKGSVLNNQTEDKKPLILPTPTSLPKISLPIKYLGEFKDFYPKQQFTFDKKHLFFVSFT